VNVARRSPASHLDLYEPRLERDDNKTRQNRDEAHPPPAGSDWRGVSQTGMQQQIAQATWHQGMLFTAPRRPARHAAERDSPRKIPRHDTFFDLPLQLVSLGGSDAMFRCFPPDDWFLQPSAL